MKKKIFLILGASFEAEPALKILSKDITYSYLKEKNLTVKKYANKFFKISSYDYKIKIKKIKEQNIQKNIWNNKYCYG